ncbi:hypothetical protein AtDm6_0658 [Acetobacter tropicalis]|uniref:Uncharacterized protein n=2 Tax=Acetobacter tropicalis TaxID=104102 RepID=F7VAS6_9PROT|nr:hypothetical protein AtDm6_0658 [Acetobacter tropicalis]GAA07471.1 hypothetical protein ATPR_0475 [Acetobacter tropicalis NBRC 101654]
MMARGTNLPAFSCCRATPLWASSTIHGFLHAIQEFGR